MARTERALEREPRLAIGGGVAANRLLRERALALGVPVHVPPHALCTDNAAMIGSAARFVTPTPYPDYLALDAYATRRADVSAGRPSRHAATAGVAPPDAARHPDRLRRAASSRVCARAAHGENRHRGGAAVVAVVIVVLLTARARSRTSRRRPRRWPTPSRTTGARRCSRPGRSSACWSSSGGRRSARCDDARAIGAEEQRRYLASLKKEAATLRSALEARGVVLRDVVGYYRVWNGFSATVSTRDLARLNSPGVRVRTVRRAYPASGEPVPVAGKPELERAGLSGQPPVAVLDTGIDSEALEGHADPGYDAVDRDRDPAPGRDPGGGERRETSGTALAGVVAATGERVLPIRIASLRAVGGTVEASTTTDRLLAGLEHAVDPNGDDDTSDHVPVALVGVNAPYASFSNSPEAQAVEGAAGLGTLVVAPAGNEGPAAPGSSTIGSLASAREALAVGTLTGTGAVAAGLDRGDRRGRGPGRRPAAERHHGRVPSRTPIRPSWARSRPGSAARS